MVPSLSFRSIAYWPPRAELCRDSDTVHYVRHVMFQECGCHHSKCMLLIMVKEPNPFQVGSGKAQHLLPMTCEKNPGSILCVSNLHFETPHGYASAYNHLPAVSCRTVLAQLTNLLAVNIKQHRNRNHGGRQKAQQAEPPRHTKFGVHGRREHLVILVSTYQG